MKIDNKLKPWVGNNLTINPSELEDLRTQFYSSDKSESMRNHLCFEDWVSSCVSMSSELILGFMFQAGSHSIKGKKAAISQVVSSSKAFRGA